MAVPSAEDMADIVWSVGEKLLEAGIVDSQAMTAFSGLKAQLKGQKGNEKWSISVDRGLPIVFSKCLDERGDLIVPKIVAEGISVNSAHSNHPPFDALDLALEVEYENGKPLVRWHIDRANFSGNAYQEGPLFHIQFGGHHHENRSLDLPIKIPRWNHPPLDIVLLCEVVAANFFPEEWMSLREDPSWCDYVSQCEKYCYTAYIDKFRNVLNTSSKTVLGQFWASDYLL